MVQMQTGRGDVGDELGGASRRHRPPQDLFYFGEELRVAHRPARPSQFLRRNASELARQALHCTTIPGLIFERSSMRKSHGDLLHAASFFRRPAAKLVFSHSREQCQLPI
jgi:hypothetical protein